MKNIRKHTISAALAALAILAAFAVTAPMAMAEEVEQEQIVVMESAAEEVQESDGGPRIVVVEAEEAAEPAEAEAEEWAAAVGVEAGTAVGVPYGECSTPLQDAQRLMEDQVDKSEGTKKFEEVMEYMDYTKPLRDKIDEMVDNTDFGDPEKELMKDVMKIGTGALNGELLPGIGTVQKATQAMDEFQKAAEATTTLSTVYHSVKGAEKALDAVVTTIPGGGAVVGIKEAVKSGVFYVFNKIW